MFTEADNFERSYAVTFKVTFLTEFFDFTFCVMKDVK